MTLWTVEFLQLCCIPLLLCLFLCLALPVCFHPDLNSHQQTSRLSWSFTADRRFARLSVRAVIVLLAAPLGTWAAEASPVYAVYCADLLLLKASYLLHHRGGPHLSSVHSPVDTTADRFLSTKLIKGNIRGKKQNKNNKTQLVFTSAVSAAAKKT